MILAKIVGTVVATHNALGGVFRLVSPCLPSGDVSKSPIIALDIVNSREGDVVMVAQGSSCRWTEQTDGYPVDALVIGIVDTVTKQGLDVYKSELGGNE